MKSSAEALEGMVVCGRSGYFEVQLEDGALECRVRGRLKKVRHSADPVVIGDRVRVERVDDRTGMIAEALPRRSRFSRRQPGPSGKWKEDVLIANVDQVIVVFAVSEPPLNRRMLDRFLVIAEHNRVAAIVVINKIDLADSSDDDVHLLDYQELGYPVYPTSTKTMKGVTALASSLEHKMSVCTGPSGVGKSSLVNAIEPGLGLRISETSAATGKGRHTTRVACLHPLSRGGHVADTPGIREIGMWNLPADDLPACFPEFRTFLGSCGFGNCRHDREPRCAIQRAVQDGLIRPARYESYLRLLHDARAETRG